MENVVPFLIFCLGSTIFQEALSLDNGLALRPPMGWKSWNCYLGEISDGLIRSVMDTMVSRERLVDGKPTSLVDLGYDRLGIDDGWQACEMGPQHTYHAQDGTPLVNLSRFPNKFKNLVAYGHSRGLWMDFYQINCICMDTYTLRANQTWAKLSWDGNVRQILEANFDGVKIDNCGDDDGGGYASMLATLRNMEILVENSNQGNGHGPPRGLPTDPDGWCDFHMFRTGGDIQSNFASVMAKLQRTIPFQNLTNPISRPSCWAYPDMLEVGNFGSNINRDRRSNNRDITAQNEDDELLSVTESRTHFGAWCIVSSPLFLSLDILDKTRLDRVWDIITNREAIAINQAWHGHPGRLVRDDPNGKYQIWAKKLGDGAQAAIVLNKGSTQVNVSVTLDELGILDSKVCKGRDVWNKRDLPNLIDTVWEVTRLGEHDNQFVVLTPIDSSELPRSSTSIV